MRFLELTESTQVTPVLVAWIKTWVESSFKVELQAASFEAIRDEASYMLNVAYPAIFRGLSITEENAEAIVRGETITIPAHLLQSWTKSRGVADDFAIPGYGGNVGLLIKKTGRQVKVVFDIENAVRRIGRRQLKHVLGNSSIVTDAAREREVVVETYGSLVIHPKDVIKLR